jgi:hypothetical protein
MKNQKNLFIDNNNYQNYNDKYKNTGHTNPKFKDYNIH